MLTSTSELVTRLSPLEPEKETYCFLQLKKEDIDQYKYKYSLLNKN